MAGQVAAAQVGLEVLNKALEIGTNGQCMRVLFFRVFTANNIVVFNIMIRRPRTLRLKIDQSGQYLELNAIN